MSESGSFRPLLEQGGGESCLHGRASRDTAAMCLEVVSVVDPGDLEAVATLAA